MRRHALTHAVGDVPPEDEIRSRSPSPGPSRPQQQALPLCRPKTPPPPFRPRSPSPFLTVRKDLHALPFALSRRKLPEETTGPGPSGLANPQPPRPPKPPPPKKGFSIEDIMRR